MRMALGTKRRISVTMKPVLRSPIVVAILSRLIWAWMVLVVRTVRWRIEGAEEARRSWSEQDGVVVAAWHSRIMVLPAAWILFIRGWKDRISKGAMLISLSADGEPVARAIGHLDLHAVRGSAANKKKNKDKGGVRAIAEAIRLLRSGTAVCITPDGPRGPAEQVSPGAITIAQRAGAPILPYALSISPAWRLGTWDRFIIPFPFTRGAIVLGELLPTSRESDSEILRSQLQARLDAASRRADILVGIHPASTPDTAS